MKRKIIILNKMAAICCFMILALFNSKVSSQIIYTDIADATPSATYPLDLNNDSIDDFLIQFDLSDKLLCKPQNNNAYAGEFVGGLHLPWALSSSIDICDSLITWYDASNLGTMAWGTSIGNWVGATNKYLALKLVVGANTYYGWARLDVESTSSSFTIKDYAYESTPNACIESGQIALGINENTTNNAMSVFPNPFNSTTTLITIKHLKNATLTITNSYGQAVKQVKNIKGQTLSLSLETLPSGIYFIRLEDENKIVGLEKILIID
jgi:Secretion system C-terminal sorting domain